MFIGFVEALRAAGVPASLKEHLLLLEALDAEVIDRTPEQFYYLSRSIFVKDEALIDRLVPAGHPSTPGYSDPAYPLEGRISRAG